jgi:hypothetical protein
VWLEAPPAIPQRENGMIVTAGATANGGASRHVAALKEDADEDHGDEEDGEDKKHGALARGFRLWLQLRALRLGKGCRASEQHGAPGADTALVVRPCLYLGRRRKHAGGAKGVEVFLRGEGLGLREVWEKPSCARGCCTQGDVTGGGGVRVV